MANPPKQQGTAAETKHARAANARGLLKARRAENNAPGRDVDITLRDGTVVPHEVKDRANLNVHKLVAEVADKQPGFPPIVIWDRKSRKGDNVRRSADGPTIVAMPRDFWFDVLEVLSVLAHEQPWHLHFIRDRWPGLDTWNDQ